MKYWMQSLLILVFAAGSAWVMSMKSERDDLRAEIARRDQIAAEANTQAENNLEHIRTQIPVMVEQAQANAVENYRARYGNRGRTCPDPVVIHGMQPQAWSDGQAQGASGTDARSANTMADPAIEFAQQCAATTALYNAWRELCRSNPLTCEVKE